MPTRKRPLPTPGTAEEAHKLEERLAQQVRLGHSWKYVAAVDVAWNRARDHAYAVAVVVSTSNWRVIADARKDSFVKLSDDGSVQGWREAPIMISALTKLSIEPDVIFVDGHGIAHERRAGVACLVGVALDYETIGVSTAYPHLCMDAGALQGNVRRGSHEALLVQPGNHKVGAKVFTQPQEDPVYVSPGHRVSLEEAVSLTLKASPWHRLPEALRLATEAADKYRDAVEGV